MSESVTKFNEAICRRTMQIRQDMGLTRKAMAEAVGCTEFTLQKYEIRSPLPHHLIPKFCELTGFSSWYLLTGQAREPGHEPDK